MQFRSLGKALAVLALGAGALGATSAAHANGGVTWSVGVHAAPGVVVNATNGRPVYVQPSYGYVQPAVQPVYVQPYPQTIYTPPPVVYAPAPVYYPGPAFIVRGGPVFRGGHGHGHGNGHGGHGRGHGRH